MLLCVALCYVVECRRICIHGAATYKILNLNVNVNRHVLYSNKFCKSLSFKQAQNIKDQMHHQHKNKNVKNVTSPFSNTFPVHRQATNEAHITHCKCIWNAMPLLLLLLLVRCMRTNSSYFMDCNAYCTYIQSFERKIRNATSKERNFSICAVVAEHTKTIKWHITS